MKNSSSHYYAEQNDPFILPKTFKKAINQFFYCKLCFIYSQILCKIEKKNNNNYKIYQAKMRLSYKERNEIKLVHLQTVKSLFHIFGKSY